nr:hypothetical protein [Tanacetum cinerariifolium]
QKESETGTKGLVEVRVKRDMHLAMPEDTPKPTQEERPVECMYETLGSLVQRFYDHTVAIPVHRGYRLLRESIRSKDIGLLGLSRQSLP